MPVIGVEKVVGGSTRTANAPKTRKVLLEQWRVPLPFVSTISDAHLSHFEASGMLLSLRAFIGMKGKDELPCTAVAQPCIARFYRV